MHRFLLPLLVLGVLVAGCHDSTSPRDTLAPVAPRGLYGVTGDGQVTLHWVGNSEPDLAGYRIWINEASCTGGPDCTYRRIDDLEANAAGEYMEYTVTGLTNGETRFFAVSAVDRAGNDSPLSYQDVWDTPRPAGTGTRIGNYLKSPSTAGYDFSDWQGMTGGVLSYGDLRVDMFYGRYVDNAGFVYQQIFVPDYSTDIQDAGFAVTLDAVDFAPDAADGWSPSGTVEAVAGHCYVVWTRDNHFAKFRVTAVDSTHVTFDWAYQTDPGNRELRATRPPVSLAAAARTATARRPIVWLAR